MAEFKLLANLADEMAATASRLKKRAAIAAAIANVQEAGARDVALLCQYDVALFCQYLAGLPFAESDPRKLNAGGALLTRAVRTVSGANDAELGVAYRRHGDLGAAAEDLLAERGHVSSGGLTLCDVADAFAAMASAKTTAIRFALVEGLLRRASPVEAKYLLKLMLGDMRIGVKQSLVEEAIASASGADVSSVRHAVMLEADLGDAAVRAFAGTLADARMRLFHPLGFMLASPVDTPEEAIERFTPQSVKPPAARETGRRKNKATNQEAAPVATLHNDAEAAMLAAEEQPSEARAENSSEATPETTVQAFLEDKFDGMRAQIHCGARSKPGRVAIYSRNREDITESFPELVEAFSGVATDDGEGLIFDGEILGWDFASGQALPFAVLGQRIGRKRVDNAIRQQVPVIFMAFDLMFAGGALLLHQPLHARRMRLEAEMERLLETVRAPLVLSEAAEQNKAPQAVMFADAGKPQQLLPRLMISPARLVENAAQIDRAYADARARANEGVMLKAADSIYQPGRRGLAWVKLKRQLATLDVVITGAEWGNGRKAGFLSDYTFAVRDEDGELKNVGKAYSGVTDAEIAELTEFLKAQTLEDNGHFRTVEPLIVLEVAFNNIMRSDRHASGFALRFPRILHIRRDKPLDEIDTVARVEEVYQSQVDKPAE
jgi:DNA ligase-1